MDSMESLLHCDVRVNFRDLARHTDFELTYARSRIEAELRHRARATRRTRHRVYFHSDNCDLSYLHLCVREQLQDFREILGVELRRRALSEQERHLIARQLLKERHREQR
ncbi:hypothetical protein Bcep1808_6927 (plasmid) [Burkholderia vietnamiensis G4]|uniref:Uncharacterized protein n=1 Tax=Burkholderia vietnamiensis (strain G4 / LMG 22486) TaxID=269482 RepID=A4JU61_BURVG|nr:hypothetical protein Bcep1808_6927 [Burkholderia vietnamiensis G4]